VEFKNFAGLKSYLLLSYPFANNSNWLIIILSRNRAQFDKFRLETGRFFAFVMKEIYCLFYHFFQVK